jgi:hypothetical protein
MKTNKQEFNKRHGFKLNESHSMEELSKISGFPIDILLKVDDRGQGAWSTNLRSVRTKGTFKKNQDLPRSQKLSAQQWGISRVYAFINKFEKGYIPNHDVDLLREYFINAD